MFSSDRNYMLSDQLFSWEEVSKISPEALVLWDIAGGPEWLGNRSGPRIKMDTANQQIVVFVGHSIEGVADTNVVSANALDDWDYAVFNYSTDKKWVLGRNNILAGMGIKL